MIRCTLVTIALAAAALGTQTLRGLQVHEKRDTIPPGYSLIEAASSDTDINLRLALAQNNISGLIDTLYEVSTPSSAKYGQYLSKEEVELYTAPSRHSASVVNEWLSKSGLNATTLAGGQWMSIQLPVGQANALLGANFSVFTHGDSGAQVIRTLAYSLPEDLVGHVECIHPTVSFPSSVRNTAALQVSHGTVPPRNPRPNRKTDKRLLSSTISPCDAFAMTPACLQYLYNIPVTPALNESNLLYVTGFTDEWPQRNDLSQFLQMFRPDVNSSTTYTLQLLDNGTDVQNATEAGGEADLDIEYAMSLATNVSTTFLSVGDLPPTSDDFVDFLLDAANFILGLPIVPQTVTTSYGLNENLVSEKLANTLCNAYAALGARGVSMIFPSGDGGVSGLHYPLPSEGTCTTFVPTFPSTCPYVTSVGGTANIPEEAATLSAGGFSNIFSVPAYQYSATSTYIASLDGTNSGLYNATGCGFPDVSAYAEFYTVIQGGVGKQDNGTSASAPVFAAMISLLNDQLISAGKPALGFLNPLLYSTAISAFNDITSGDNYACSDYTTGFEASNGWDPVTGLGTPDFNRLKAAVGV